MYDAPSDFTTGSAFDAYWFYGIAGSAQICAAIGRTVVDDARAALGLGRTGAWDEALQAALLGRVRALTTEDAAWGAVATQLAADATARVVSTLSLAVAIYFAYYRPRGRQFDALTVPGTTRTPLWGVPLPGAATPDASGGIVCWDPARENGPATGATLAAQRARSTSGVQVYDASLAPPASAAGTASSDVSNTVLWIAGAALVGLIAFTVARP